MNAQPNIFRWLFLIALVMILGGGWIIVNRSSQETVSADLEPAPVKGHPAPEISLVSLEGEQVRLSQFQGKPVVVNFWATWCPPCRAEMPDFQQVHRELGDEVVILGINGTTQDSGDIPGFINEFGITFPIVLDTEGQAFRDYKILGMPTTVFIDRDGIIHEVFTGPVNKAYIESRLSEL